MQMQYYSVLLKCSSKVQGWSAVAMVCAIIRTLLRDWKSLVYEGFFSPSKCKSKFNTNVPYKTIHIFITYYFQQSITVPIRVVKKAHKHIILYMLGSHFYENTMSGRNRMVLVVLTHNKEAKTKSYWRKRQNINVRHPKRLQWSYSWKLPLDHLRKVNINMKVDGLGPVDNRPSSTQNAIIFYTCICQNEVS